MKKFILLLLTVSLIALSFTGCDSNNKTNSSIPSQTEQSTTLVETEHQHTWLDATCKAPKTCTTCGETDGEKLSTHSINNGKCTSCGIDTYEEFRSLAQNFKIDKTSTNYDYLTVRIQDTCVELIFDLGYDSACVMVNRSGCSSHMYDWGFYKRIVGGGSAGGSFDASRYPAASAYDITYSSVSKSTYSVCISIIMDELFFPIIEGSDSLSLADYGFVNY